jgi:hypothetical protein
MCPCCDCRDRIYTCKNSPRDAPPPPHYNQSSSSMWSSRVYTRIVVLMTLGIVILMNGVFSSLLLGKKDTNTNSRLGDEKSNALRLGLAFLTENLNSVDESAPSDRSTVTRLPENSFLNSLAADQRKATSRKGTSTNGRLTHTAEQESSSSHTSTNPSGGTLPIVYESNNITTLPPHVVNHYIVNMNGRKLLGQGEKIILVGMPKSGTTTVGAFFEESKRYRVCDFICPLPVVNLSSMGNRTGGGNTNNRNKLRRQYIGQCMASAKRQNLPLIKTCGDYDMYAQLDYPMTHHDRCHLPQITMLQDFHNEHPHATFILNLRNASHWSSSVHRWRGLGNRLSKCPLGPNSKSPISLRQWYYLHVQRIRRFVAMHPSHALVEIDVEHEDTGKRMAAIFGIQETCWVSRPNKEHAQRAAHVCHEARLELENLLTQCRLLFHAFFSFDRGIKMHIHQRRLTKSQHSQRRLTKSESSHCKRTSPRPYRPTVQRSVLLL